eukprot:scaffold176293_cov38-Cyclotella_meneghiniana.AAC.2
MGAVSKTHSVVGLLGAEPGAGRAKAAEVSLGLSASALRQANLHESTIRRTCKCTIICRSSQIQQKQISRSRERPRTPDPLGRQI